MVAPSGLNASASTKPFPEGGVRVAVSVLVTMFHRYMLPLLSPTARVAPSGANATTLTPVVLGSMRVPTILPVLVFQRDVWLPDSPPFSGGRIFSEPTAR